MSVAKQKLNQDYGRFGMSTDAQSEAGEIVEMPEVQAELSALATSDAPICVHNFTGDLDTQWRLSCAATGADTKKGGEHLNIPIEIHHWYVNQATVKNEQGVPVLQPRVVLITPQGEAFGFVSQGVFDYLRLLVHHKGKGPYDPPIEVIVRAIKTGEGNNYYTMEPTAKTSKGKRTKS